MATVMTAFPPPILTAHLFEELDGRLIDLLESLSADEWRRPTIVPTWNVKQVAAHLLDTATRRLSLVRDQEPASTPQVRSDRQLTDFINDLNASGVEVFGRLSPRVLLSLTRVVVRDLHQYLAGLDPFAPAAFAVSWAGEKTSPNWFDTARELTERWHHQQQIRLAVDRPGIMTRRLYGPVIECFMRGLPHAYRSIASAPGDVAVIQVKGECGGTWHLERAEDRWALTDSADATKIVARTTIPQEIAWQIFTKAIPLPSARERVSIEGDERIGTAVLGMIAIVG
jgi:uncharacterized protein (TIGR03083 family)